MAKRPSVQEILEAARKGGPAKPRRAEPAAGAAEAVADADRGGRRPRPPPAAAGPRPPPTCRRPRRWAGR